MEANDRVIGTIQHFHSLGFTDVYFDSLAAARAVTGIYEPTEVQVREAAERLELLTKEGYLVRILVTNSASPKDLCLGEELREGLGETNLCRRAYNLTQKGLDHKISR